MSSPTPDGVEFLGVPKDKVITTSGKEIAAYFEFKKTSAQVLCLYYIMSDKFPEHHIV